MTPLEKIKNGIQSTNWNLVVDGYNSMTGDNVVLPENVDLPIDNSALIYDLLEVINNHITTSDIDNEENIDNTDTDEPKTSIISVLSEDELKRKQKESLEKDAQGLIDIQQENALALADGDHAGPSYGMTSGRVDARHNKIIMPMAEIEPDESMVAINQNITKKNPKLKLRKSPPKIKCPMCTKELDEMRNLIRTSFEKGKAEKEVKCPHCRQTFIRN